MNDCIGIRQSIGKFVVVCDDYLNAKLFGDIDFFGVGDPAIHGNDEFYSLAMMPPDLIRVQAVPIRHAVRCKIGDVGLKDREAAIEDC